MPKRPIRIESSASDAFRDWLARADGAMVVTTYQAGKVAVVGWDGARVTLLMREFDKTLGIAHGHNRMVLATRNDVWLLANAPLLAPDYLEDQPGRYDALYLPRATYHTGDLNVHDVALSGEDVILVNTRFSCLARLSADHSFTPFWRPPFVTDLVPEDRCHLNGLAMRYGRPCQVSVERIMGCGLGGCYSCVIPIKTPEGTSHFVRSCLNGPVFDGNALVWE